MTQDRELRLCVHRVDWKCIDTEGYWDGTWDYSYEWAIYDEEGYQLDGWGGFHSEEKARIAGEKALKRMEERR